MNTRRLEIVVPSTPIPVNENERTPTWRERWTKRLGSVRDYGKLAEYLAYFAGLTAAGINGVFIYVEIVFNNLYSHVALLAALVLNSIGLALAIRRIRKDKQAKAGLSQALTQIQADYDSLCHKHSISGQAHLLFQELSSLNAQCDRDLFDGLYSDLCRSDYSSIARAAARASEHLKDTIRKAELEDVRRSIAVVVEAKQDVAKHLVEIMGVAVRLFNLHTNDTCAACIKYLPAGPITEDTLLRDLGRDRTSQSKRPQAEGAPYPIKDNTDSMTIFEDKERDYYIENDLWTAYQNGKYKNSRKNWHDFYNATIVHLIPPVPGASPEGGSTRMLGFFCIDNKLGRFDEDLCLVYMKIICYRLSVLIYRYFVLDRDQELLVSVATALADATDTKTSRL
jgi:hypothetical protein